MDYKELIGKTIFDFTKDAALIERVTKVNPSFPKPNTCLSKNQKFALPLHPNMRHQETCRI